MRTVTIARSGTRFDGDTSREALRVQYAALRRTTAAQRLAFMDDLTRLVQEMTREGLRRRHPALTQAELDARYSELVLGRRLAAEVLEHRRARLARPAP
jgi:phage gp16-like protein